jgi:hypothetical protein
LVKHYVDRYLPTRKDGVAGAIIAMEEGYSETVEALALLYLSGRKTRRELPYNKGLSVSPVSHSEQNDQYTDAAETTYPSEEEYQWLLDQLFGDIK